MLREILEAEDMKENRRERGQMGTMEGEGLSWGGAVSEHFYESEPLKSQHSAHQVSVTP